MTTIDVQFSDASQAVIISYFAMPQNPGSWPNQGTVDTSDARWKAYFSSVPAMMQSGLPLSGS